MNQVVRAVQDEGRWRHDGGRGDVAGRGGGNGYAAKIVTPTPTCRHHGHHVLARLTDVLVAVAPASLSHPASP